MTVNATATTRNVSTAAAGATVFPYGFKITDSTHLLVTVNGTAKVLGSDYTVDGVGSDGGGNLTFAVPMVGGETVVRMRNMPYARATDFQSLGDLLSSTLNADQDDPVLMIQQLAEAIARALVLNPGAGQTVSGQLPVPVAGQLLGWNADATALQSVDPSGPADLTLRTNLATAGSSLGAYLLAFLQGGSGAVAQNLQTMLRATIVTPEQFGAVRDGVTDDQPAFARAVAYLASINGGIVDCQQGRYAIGSTVLVQASNITIRGRGADQFHNSGSGSLPATVFKWIGAASGEVVRFETPAVITSNKRNSGGMSDVHIDCNAVAGTGLRVQSWDRGRWVRLYVLNATQQAFKVSCHTTGKMAEATDSQQNFFEQCTWRMVDSGAVQNASGFVLTSDVNGSAGNTSFNTFHRCGGLNYNAYGYVLTDCDNNIFIGCGGTVLGTGFGVLLNGGYGNYFQGFSGTCRVYGTASGAWANSLNNVFYAVDESNGTVYPTVDAGCTIQWHGHKYGHYQLMSTKAVLSDANTNTLAQAASLGASTLRVHNGAQDHIRITDGTHEWGLRITSDGALHLDRLAGTGTLQLGGDVSVGSWASAGDQGITGYLTIKDAAGNTRKLATIA